MRPRARPTTGSTAAGSPTPRRAPYGILLHATARPEKEWPEPNWVALGRALNARGTLLLPWGSDAERLRSERIAAGLADARVPERRPLDAMARLIAGASFVVGVDTGLLHLAAALGVPVVAIFAGSEPGLTGPMGRGRSPSSAATGGAAGRRGRGGTRARRARMSRLIRLRSQRGTGARHAR